MRALSVTEIEKAVGGTLLCGNPETKVRQVTIDSREEAEQGLFVPLVGEKTDGHKYVAGAIAGGAKVLFLQKTSVYREAVLKTAGEQETAVIEVTDTLEALQRLAAWYRSQFSLPIVGITGSVGKTTTKEMISAALETKKKVLKTIGNKNSQIGVSLMMLCLEDDYDIAVIEMGMSETGEMAKLTAVAKPECAVMTNIGVAHLAQLKTKENIRKEKLSIVNACGENSYLFVNGNDILLNETATQITHKSVTIDCNKETYAVLQNITPVTYGIGDGFDYRASDITTDTTGTSFVLTYPEKTAAGTVTEQLTMHLKVFGEHNVMNALAAVAVAQAYGIAPQEAAKGLALYEPIAMRGQVKEKDGVVWIDDTYNASPDSMRSGIEVLLSLDAGRRIAVFADVLELGEQSEQLHREVGAYAATFEKENKKTDLLVTVGENASYIAKEANARGLEQTKSFSSNAEAIAYLKQEIKSKDAVLVKGSRGMRTDEIVRAFLG